MRFADKCEHKDRKYYCKGKCKKCYEISRLPLRRLYGKESRVRIKFSGCTHPERPVKSGGMCGSCYSISWRKRPGRMAECHPERRHSGNGRCAACQMKDWRQKNPERTRQVAMKHAEKVREIRAGRPRPEACEACGQKTDKTVFDHDHAIDLFRGWICNNDNIVLGLVEDSIPRLRSLIEYLERTNTRTTNNNESLEAAGGSTDGTSGVPN